MKRAATTLTRLRFARTAYCSSATTRQALCCGVPTPSYRSFDSLTTGFYGPLLRSTLTTTRSLSNASQATSATVATPPQGDCPGCGAPFQTHDPSKPGYYVERKNTSQDLIAERKRSSKSMSDAEFQAAVSALDPELRVLLEGEAALDEEVVITSKNNDVQTINEEEEEEEKKLDVCHRCYALKHYNHITTDTSPAFLRATQQYGSLEFLKTKRNPLIVVVLDVSDLPFSLGSQLPELIRQNPSARIMIAANKFDMLPQRARRHEQRIRDWIVQHLKQHGFPTQQIRGVSLVSAKKGWGVLGLLRRIDEERLPTDDVYLVGCTNVGKSALMNQILSQRASKNKRQQYQITSSAVPGTTMGTLRIPLHALHMGTPQQTGGGRRFLEREHYLIDTPGVVNDQQLIHLMPFKEQKKLMRHTEFKPVTFRLEAGRSLLLDSFARIDVVEASDPVLFTMFTPMVPHITKTLKMMNKESPLQPIPQLLSVRGVHKSRASVDLAFASIGWIAVAGMFDNARLRVWLPDNVNPVEGFAIREPAMLPFEYQGVIRKFFGSGHRARQ